MATLFPVSRIFIVAFSMWALLLLLLGVPPQQVLLAVAIAAAVMLAVAGGVARSVGRHMRFWAFALVFLVTGTALAQSTIEYKGTLSEEQLGFITKWANDAWFAIVNREWWLLAGIVFSGLTAAWRFGLVDYFWKDSAADRFFDHPLVALLTPGVLSLGSGLSAGFAGTGPFAVDQLVASTVKVWATSVLTFMVVKKAKEALAKKPTPAPGAA